MYCFQVVSQISLSVTCIHTYFPQLNYWSLFTKNKTLNFTEFYYILTVWVCVPITFNIRVSGLNFRIPEKNYSIMKNSFEKKWIICWSLPLISITNSYFYTVQSFSQLYVSDNNKLTGYYSKSHCSAQCGCILYYQKDSPNRILKLHTWFYYWFHFYQQFHKEKNSMFLAANTTYKPDNP
jgi:hypothetical protein